MNDTILLGVCAMSNKLTTDRMNEIMRRLNTHPIKVVLIDEKIMFSVPVRCGSISLVTSNY